MPKPRISAKDLMVILRRKRLGLPVNNVRDYIYQPGVYGFSEQGEIAKLRALSAENTRIDRQVYDRIQYGGVRPAARQKLVNLIRKTRKKSGRTYYQRAQTAQLTSELRKEVASKPITAKKYVKGVDFGYGKIASFGTAKQNPRYIFYWRETV